MREIKVHPLLKFLLLFAQLIIVMITNDPTKILILSIFMTVILVGFRVKLKSVVMALSYGLFLGIFTFVFNYIFSNAISYAVVVALNVIGRFYLIIAPSILYKQYTSNKEIAYVISIIASKFGFKQNQVYTIVLVILNQIYNLRNLIFDLYKYNRIESSNQSKSVKIKRIIKLLPVFINNSLRQNDSFTLALLNKNYHPEKQINVYLNYNISTATSILLIILFGSELLVIFK